MFDQIWKHQLSDRQMVVFLPVFDDVVEFAFYSVSVLLHVEKFCLVQTC